MEIIELTDLPPELLEIFFRYLPLRTLYSLYNMYNKRLRKLMSTYGAVRRLYCDDEHHSKDFLIFGRFVPQLFHLTHFVSNSAFYDPKWLEYLPRTLTHLKLPRISPTFSVFDDPTEYPKTSFYRFLPPKLELFDTGTLLAQDLQYLPCVTLKHLRFQCHGLTESVIENLPQNLLFLDLAQSNFKPGFVPLLPAGLQYLSVLATGTWCEETLKALPGNLESLEVRGKVDMKTEDLKYLPRNLTRLDGIRFNPDSIGSVIEKIHADHMNHLPVNLQHLRIPIVKKMAEESLKCLLVSLISFASTSFGEIYGSPLPWMTDSHLSSFPPLLTKLQLPHINGISVDGVSLLPRTLVHLEWTVHDSILRSHVRLPSGLETLILTNETNQRGSLAYGFFYSLPAGLKKLHVYFETRLHRGNLACFPSNLLDLHLDKCSLLETSDILLLPQNLNTLSLKGRSPDGAGLDVDEMFIANLPRSVTNLTLDDCQSVHNESLRQLSPRLYRCTLFKSPNLDAEVINYLPRSLRYLSVYGNSKLKAELFEDLPSDQDLFEARPHLTLDVQD